MTRDWLIQRRGSMSIDALSQSSGVPKVIIAMLEDDDTVITSPNFIVKLAPFYHLKVEEFNGMVHAMWAVEEVPPPDTRFVRNWDSDISLEKRTELAKAAFLHMRPNTRFKPVKEEFNYSLKPATRGVYRNGEWMSIRKISEESGIDMNILYARYEKGARTYETLTEGQRMADPEHLKEISEKKPAPVQKRIIPRSTHAMPRTDLGRKAVITIAHDGQNLTLREVSIISGMSYSTVRRRYEHGYRSYTDLTRFHADRPDIQPGIGYRFKNIVTLGDGSQMTLKDISEKSGIATATLQKRYEKGIRDYEALTAPVKRHEPVRPEPKVDPEVEKRRMMRRAKNEARRAEELEKRRIHLERLNKLKDVTPIVPKGASTRRLAHLVEYNGKMYTIGEIADALGYSRDTLYKRMRAGATTFEELTKERYDR